MLYIYNHLHLPVRRTALHELAEGDRASAARTGRGSARDAIIVRKLNEQIAKALADPETNKLLTNQAMQAVGNTPDAFAAFIQKNIAIWNAVAASASVKVE